MNAALDPSLKDPAGPASHGLARDARDAATVDERRLSTRDLLAYGMFGLPLALVALPVYVLVPISFNLR